MSDSTPAASSAKTKSARRILLPLLPALLGLAVFLVFASTRHGVQVGNSGRLECEIANSADERAQGLSDRDYTLKTCMLFVYPEDLQPEFWMKDMHFALDIIWIDSGKHVVGVEKNVAPESYPDTFSPPSAIRYVLEVPAGSAERWGIAPGTAAEF